MSAFIAQHILYSDSFPFLDIAHNLSAAVEVRNELDGNGRKFSKNHYFASWILTIAYIFSGSLTTNLLLGEPVIAPFLNTKLVFLGSVIWFIVFFSPRDCGYQAATLLPTRLVAGVLNEIYRVRKIGYGLLQASQIYPNSWFILIAIATIKSNGSGLMKLLIRQMQGTQTLKDIGFMQLPLPTKLSMLAAFLLILEKSTDFFGSYELLQLVIVFVFVYIRLCGFLEGNYLNQAKPQPKDLKKDD